MHLDRNNHQHKPIMTIFRKFAPKRLGRILADHRSCQMSQLYHTSVKMSNIFLGYINGNRS